MSILWAALACADPDAPLRCEELVTALCANTAEHCLLAPSAERCEDEVYATMSCEDAVQVSSDFDTCLSIIEESEECIVLDDLPAECEDAVLAVE